MAKPEILNEKPIAMFELKAEIDRIMKKDEEVSDNTRKTDEYLKKFIKLKPAKSKELVEKLAGLKIPRLKEQHISKIADILPKTQDDVKAVLEGYTISVTAESMKKIAEAVSDVLGEEKGKKE